MKRCTKCKNILNEEDFYKDSSKINGRSSQCKGCERASRRSGTKTKEAFHKYYIEHSNTTRRNAPFMGNHGNRDNRSKHPYYNLWANIIYRCYNVNASGYAHYGGRGIRVCDEWKDPVNGFWNFVEYIANNLGPRPYGHSINRIDNDGNYEPGNIEWADNKSQQRNTRVSRNLEFAGRVWTLEELGSSKYCRVPCATFYSRIYMGWCVTKALLLNSGAVNNYYTNEEIDLIVNKEKYGLTYKEIARQIGRTARAVSQKATELRRAG